MTKLLTPDQVDLAKRMGCIYPVRVMPESAARRYREAYEAYERASNQNAPRHLKIKRHLLFTWMMELATEPKLLDAIEDLIGPDIMLVTSAIWAKNAHDSAFVTWHQDSAYFGYEPMDVWGAWVALTDSLVEHGCLRYLPGSHLQPEMRHIETYHPDNLLQRGQQIPGIDETGAVDAEVQAGEASLHHFRLAHSSKPNTSDHRRIGILFVYCPPYVRPTLGRYPARLVRGVNRFDHWAEDPLPKSDLDPEAIAYFEKFLARYNDPAVQSEVTSVKVV
jgi:ectoine hydroxylase-related dioxygenase (phytanoyl-CoA dioxygenase family)